MLFINNRLVESLRIKRAVEAAYSSSLHGKRAIAYWAYVSLAMDGARVDCNVHPTKKEVQFLNEDEICELITMSVRRAIGNCEDDENSHASRTLTNTQKSTASKSTLSSAM